MWILMQQVNYWPYILHTKEKTGIKWSSASTIYTGWSTGVGRNHMMTSQETLGAMAHRRNMKWGAQGTCLSSCDFFLWEYLKGRVYTHKPHNLNKLKDAVWQEVLMIDLQLLAWAMDDFKRKIGNCIQEDGRHLNDIIFHTWIPNSNGMSWPLIL